MLGVHRTPINGRIICWGLRPSRTRNCCQDSKRSEPCRIQAAFQVVAWAAEQKQQRPQHSQRPQRRGQRTTPPRHWYNRGHKEAQKAGAKQALVDCFGRLGLEKQKPTTRASSNIHGRFHPILSFSCWKPFNFIAELSISEMLDFYFHPRSDPSWLHLCGRSKQSA